MTLLALTCPQCGAPLPRQALWRHVVCPHCRATVTRSSEAVQRAPFRAALERARGAAADGGRVLHIAGVPHRVVRRIGSGRHVEVFLAERLDVASRVVVELARDGDGATPTSPRAAATLPRPAPTASGAPGDGAAIGASERLDREADHLRRLAELDGAGAAYWRRRLPQVVFRGAVVDGGLRREALVVRQPAGAWGSVAALVEARGHRGVDARHAVWLWRRVLEVLGHVHAHGWTHGDVAPRRLLVHPAEHGVTIVGWAGAAHGGADLERRRARDLAQAAWCVRCALAGTTDALPAVPPSTPLPLAELLRLASEDEGWRRSRSAADVEAALSRAAEASFGAPRFVPFDPLGA